MAWPEPQGVLGHLAEGEVYLLFSSPGALTPQWTLTQPPSLLLRGRPKGDKCLYPGNTAKCPVESQGLLLPGAARFLSPCTCAASLRWPAGFLLRVPDGGGFPQRKSSLQSQSALSAAHFCLEPAVESILSPTLAWRQDLG